MVKNKFFLAGLLFVISNTVFAQEIREFPGPVFSFGSSGPAPGLLADGDSFARDYTSGERAGIIGLNFFFGAGSFSHGHPGHGFLLMLLEAGGIGLLALPSLAGWELALSDKGKAGGSNSSSGSKSSDKYYNDNLTPETNAAVWCWVGGGAFLILDLIFNISWSSRYHRSDGRNAQLNNAENWKVAFVPGSNGIQRGQISFTAHF